VGIARNGFVNRSTTSAVTSYNQTDRVLITAGRDSLDYHWPALFGCVATGTYQQESMFRKVA
jgi:hypothetical protein